MANHGLHIGQKSQIEPQSGSKLFISRDGRFPSVAEALDVRGRRRGKRKEVIM